MTSETVSTPNCHPQHNRGNQDHHQQAEMANQRPGPLLPGPPRGHVPSVPVPPPQPAGRVRVPTGRRQNPFYDVPSFTAHARKYAACSRSCHTARALRSPNARQGAIRANHCRATGGQQAIWQRRSRSVQQVDPVVVQVPWMDQHREPRTRIGGIGVQREPATNLNAACRALKRGR
jgi:hypothetical protein